MTTLSPEDTARILALARELGELCVRTGARVTISGAPNVIDPAARVSFSSGAHPRPNLGDAHGTPRECGGMRWREYVVDGVDVSVHEDSSGIDAGILS